MVLGACFWGNKLYSSSIVGKKFLTGTRKDQFLSKVNYVGKRKHRAIEKETEFTLFVENMILYFYTIGSIKNSICCSYK